MTLVAESAAPLRMQRRELSDHTFTWLLIAPALLFIVLIVVWPPHETIRHSVTVATLGGESFLGVANYAALFVDPKFWQTVGRIFHSMLLAVSLTLIVGLIRASFVNAAIPGKAQVRALLLPPSAMPVATGVTTWNETMAATPIGNTTVREVEDVRLTFMPADAHLLDANGRVMRWRQAAALAA